MATLLLIGVSVLAPRSSAAPALGDSSVEPTPDESALGVAEATRFVAGGDIAVDKLALYLDASNAATSAEVGIYADAGGAPSALLARGSLGTVTNGAWNTVTIAATSLTSGQAYWLARLAVSGGSLVTRVDASIPNPDLSDARRSSSLPSQWSAGGSWPHTVSMYAIASGSATPPPSGLVGDTAVEPTADASPLGQVEANQFVASSGGAITTIAIYLDSTNRATSFALGLYLDASGAPGGLIAQGSRSATVNGAWNFVAIPTVTISAGTPYWVARLALSGGSLVTRVNNADPLPDRTDSRANATTMPTMFAPADSYPHRTSMYASGTGPSQTPGPSPTATSAATPTPAPTSTPTPAPTATPTPAPTGSAGACMEVIGFSQTYQWYFGGPPSYDQFLTQMPPRSTQLRWRGGASIDAWADPNFGGWTDGVASASCASGSANPDRIVLTISGEFHSDVAWWHDQIAQAVANARARYSGLRTIYLQPVVGGPNHAACYVGGNQVRATYNEPYISQAITRLVNEGVGVWGANPLVQSCSDYADDIGHLADSGRVSVATSVGAFYSHR